MGEILSICGVTRHEESKLNGASDVLTVKDLHIAHDSGHVIDKCDKLHAVKTVLAPVRFRGALRRRVPVDGSDAFP